MMEREKLRLISGVLALASGGMVMPFTEMGMPRRVASDDSIAYGIHADSELGLLIKGKICLLFPKSLMSCFIILDSSDNFLQLAKLCST